MASSRSDTDFDRLPSKRGVDADRIEVIPNGVDTALYYPGDKQQARESIGCPADQKMVLSVGHLKPIKGHDVLLRSMARLSGQGDVHLYFIGGNVDAQWSAQLKRLAEQLNLMERVSFLGAKPKEEVAVWLRAADVFALGSHREGCCNAVLEALASGTPAAVTRAGDNDRYVVEGATGRVVSPNDPEAMAEAIDAALCDDLDPAEVAASVGDLTWDRVADQVISFMQKQTGLDSISRLGAPPTESPVLP